MALSNHEHNDATRATALVAPRLKHVVGSAAVETFRRDGFLIAPDCIFTDVDVVQRFVGRLEAVLNGEYDTGRPPHRVAKIPAAWRAEGSFTFEHVQSHPSTCQGTRATSATWHAINVWQADRLFAALATDATLGEAVTRLMGWEGYGCRLAQDQVWIKPPHSGALTYHRDTPYLDFHPKQVCTVWIPFDPVRTVDVGTLEYCARSHLWGDERRGSASQFYHADYTALLRTAADREITRRFDAKAPGNDRAGVTLSAEELISGSTVPVICDAGCCSFHDGNTWHGSRANTTGGWRRGIGIHYIRGDAIFAEKVGKLWDDFRSSATSRELSEEFFPIVFPPELKGREPLPA